MPRYSIAALLVLTSLIAMELTAWRIDPLLAAIPLVPIGVLFLVLLVATIGRLISAEPGDNRPTPRRDTQE